MQLRLFTHCLQYICLHQVYSRWCKSHVWASFSWWTSIRITMSRGAEARACSLYASIQCSKHRLSEISSCPSYAAGGTEEIHDAQIKNDMFLKHPGTSVTGVIEWWNMKLTVDFKWAFGGGVFRYSYHWTKALKRLPRRCHGISISWFGKHYLCTQQHEKGERCHLGPAGQFATRSRVWSDLQPPKGSNFVTFVTFGWLILQYLWWHDPMHLRGKTHTLTKSLLEPASNM